MKYDIYIYAAVAAAVLYFGRNKISQVNDFWSTVIEGANEVGASLGKWIVPDYEDKWEVPYDRKPRVLDSLRGSKSWNRPTPIQYNSTGKPLGNLIQTLSPTTDKNRGGGGTWQPRVNLGFQYLGTRSNIIRGDVRALYCLDLLTGNHPESSLHTIHHLGMHAWNLSNGEYGHDYGYAIDIANPDADRVMNHMLFMANSYNMPIGWISPYKDTNGKWPIFQLRDKSKVLVGWSKINHSEPFHYHLMLPRPNLALQYVKETY